MSWSSSTVQVTSRACSATCLATYSRDLSLLTRETCRFERLVASYSRDLSLLTRETCHFSRNRHSTQISPILTVQFPTSRSSPKLVERAVAKHPMLPLPTCSHLSNQRTVPAFLLKRRCCQCIAIWYAPRTETMCHCSCCWTSYTEDVVDFINRHDVRSYFYADDMQFYASCHPDEISDVRLQLSACTLDVSQ
jgi:hypothetical protein